MTKIGSPSQNRLANNCVYVQKINVCCHGMPCALEVNSNGRPKQGCVQSCPSTTKNIISITTMPMATKLHNLIGYDHQNWQDGSTP